MKYRKSFVTNSSSSSFVCDICKSADVVYDGGCLEDIDACQCENGHEFCTDHLLQDCPTEQILADVLRKKEESEWYLTDYSVDELKGMTKDELYEIVTTHDTDEIPEILCPICQFIEYRDQDLARYLEKKYMIPRESVLQEIQEKIPRKQDIYDRDYIAFVTERLGLHIPDILTDWRQTFVSYRDFKNFIRYLM